ncbi:hypothetical protein [Dietzia timorensis]|uniref:Uncharacterized protein n=1 Tax=Dietzia timorensis TaxID=499555 RepID=A0A173LPY6_9ACTN|nr:hypothetical protein [Dietzia timorensis]ANI93754.1 Hypothetical protein BJL86_2995 [Dietzia timorensis]
MWLEGFEPSANAPEAWAEIEFDEEFGAVGKFVPRGFDAYVRVLHPVDVGGNGETMRWSEVAARFGTVIHPEVQWHRIIGSDDPDAQWEGGKCPRRGTLKPHMFARVLDALARGGKADLVTVGFWPGTGLGNPGQTPLSERERDEAYSTRGWREAYYFRGPLDELRASMPGGGATTEWGYLPNVAWPDSREWFTFSEIDYDSTIVGCSADAARSLLADKELETVEVGPESNLAYLADKIN